jgi:hypothetical protein
VKKWRLASENTGLIFRSLFRLLFCDPTPFGIPNQHPTTDAWISNRFDIARDKSPKQNRQPFVDLCVRVQLDCMENVIFIVGINIC